MTKKKLDEITKISKEFSKGFEPDIPLNGSGWLIVDPLSAYLNFLGYQNTPFQLPASDKHPQVLGLEFKGGYKFIPAGEDLKGLNNEFTNWLWI